MNSLLLDTHVLVWWRTDPDRLSKAQVRALEEAERAGRPVAISAITLWELAKAVASGRRRLTVPLDLWLEEVERNPLIEVLPLTARIAAESFQLGDGASLLDAADRIIVATARCHGLSLMTADDRVRDWGRVPVV